MSSSRLVYPPSSPLASYPRPCSSNSALQSSCLRNRRATRACRHHPILSPHPFIPSTPPPSPAGHAVLSNSQRGCVQADFTPRTHPTPRRMHKLAPPLQNVPVCSGINWFHRNQNRHCPFLSFFGQALVRSSPLPAGMMVFA